MGKIYSDTQCIGFTYFFKKIWLGGLVCIHSVSNIPTAYFSSSWAVAHQQSPPCNFPTALGSHLSTLCFSVRVWRGNLWCVNVYTYVPVCGEARTETWVFSSVFLCLVDFRQGFSLSQSWFWLDQSSWWVLRVCWSLFPGTGFLGPSCMPCFECSFICLQKSLTTELSFPFGLKKIELMWVPYIVGSVGSAFLVLVSFT